MPIKSQETQVTGTDTNTGEESQEESTLKILLKVSDKNGNIGVECRYNDADTRLLLQSIAYMLDVAFKGDEEIANKVANAIPEIVEQYFRIKNI